MNKYWTVIIITWINIKEVIKILEMNDISFTLRGFCKYQKTLLILPQVYQVNIYTLL